MADAAPCILDGLLRGAERRITRLSAPDAHARTITGAMLIDIRAADARGRDGIVPGSLHIPRTVLEWRVAIDSPWRSPHLGGAEQELVLLCDHGYSTVLAAATLVTLGFARTADVIGGFAAWRAAGLPVRRGPRTAAADGVLPGMGPPARG